MPRRGFTLAELLAVLVVTAVLWVLLLPSCGKKPQPDSSEAKPDAPGAPDQKPASPPGGARRTSMLAQSMSNLRQISNATASYGADFKDYQPIALSYRRGSGPGNNAGTPLEGLCAWSVVGKNNDAWWSGKPFDVESADRVLNVYLSLVTDADTPPAPELLSAADPARKSFQLKAFQDPASGPGHQRQWPRENRDESGAAVSAYDDVGTSYHYNILPAFQITTPANPEARLREFTRRVRSSGVEFPSRLVNYSDEWFSLITLDPDAKSKAQNAYGDVNKSIAAMFDGSVRNLDLFPGGAGSTDKNHPLLNDSYHALFSNLPIPSPDRLGKVNPNMIAIGGT